VTNKGGTVKVGKWYIGVRIGDLFVGVGRPSGELRSQVEPSRPHKGI
jgi:hypothetical protein